MPFSGKPLGSKFIREKKFNGKRLIFVPVAECEAVILAKITSKKTQSKDIDVIRNNIEHFRVLAKNSKTKLL